MHHSSSVSAVQSHHSLPISMASSQHQGPSRPLSLRPITKLRRLFRLPYFKHIKLRRSITVRWKSITAIMHSSNPDSVSLDGFVLVTVPPSEHHELAENLVDKRLH
ncbi:hypothetical protein AcW1_007091 [Taiwanofungus camphoratus]|nr:hypothetical protein AcW2_005902 [Antrodia cinnamomea]KAI0955537.1 hypothetical protein AcW1_007091 [Antrodia cinnamomea]